MMTSKKLLVSIASTPVGVLRDFGGSTSFSLLSSYRGLPSRPILGQVFEDAPRSNHVTSVRVHPWFANLLPEGSMRTFLAQQVGVNERHDFPILEQLGQDLVGAAVVQPIEVDDDELEGPELFVAEPAAPVGEDTGVRFSVAGYQLKLSMIGNRKGFTLAGRGELGNHLVKLPSPGFPNVPQNEFAMMQWAHEAGLNVPPTQLAKIKDLDMPSGLNLADGDEAFVTRRFDRTDDGGRVHIEDLNQVLGQWPDEKYENQSYDSAAGLIRRITDSEEDVIEFAKIVAFSVLIGNEDAHLKNFSVIYEDGQNARLAPAYDLVSTITYQGLKRGLGLKLGREREMAAIDLGSFRRIARNGGLNEETLRSEVRDFVQRAMDVRSPFVEMTGPLSGALASHVDALRLHRP